MKIVPKLTIHELQWYHIFIEMRYSVHRKVAGPIVTDILESLVKKGILVYENEEYKLNSNESSIT